MGALFCLVAGVRMCVYTCACECLGVSSVIRLDKGKHFILIVLLLVFSHSFIFALF